MLWDLRNSRAPEKVLQGHSGGVLSLSWCKQDSDLLLSCGKDNRTVCWNPQNGQAVGELPASQNWSYDVQWCPKNPNLVAVASFDGRISLDSLQDTNPDQQAPDTSVATTDVNDVFASLPAQSEAANRGISLTQPPKWLKKPISATFGFGGQLVSTSNLLGAQGQTQSAVVHLRKVQTEPTIAARAKRLQDAIDGQALAAFCAERSNDESTRPDDVANWKALQTLFQADSREELVALLGFSKEDVAKKVASSIGAFRRSSGLPTIDLPGGKAADLDSSIISNESAASDITTTNLDAFNGESRSPLHDEEGNNLFGSQNGGDASDFFNPNKSAPMKSALPDHLFGGGAGNVAGASAAATAGSPGPSSVASDNVRANTFRIYPDNESELDKLVTRALVLGDFESAVSLCVSTERFADAILLAVRGGPDLLARTQKAYFAAKTTSLPYLRLFQSVVGDDLSDIVQNADLNEWQEIFVVICTFAKRNEDFVNLTEQLGHRLEFQYTKSTGSDLSSAKTFRKNAVLCYLAAGKLEKVAGMWIDEMKEEENALKANGGQANGNGAHSDVPNLHTAHAEALQTFMEKISVFQSAVNYVDVDLQQPAASQEIAAARTYKLAALYDRTLEYVDLLADQGLIEPALKYVNQTPVDYRSANDNAVGITRERLRLADQARGANGAATMTSYRNRGAPTTAASNQGYAPAVYNNTAAFASPYSQAQNAYQSAGVNGTQSYNSYAASTQGPPPPAVPSGPYAPQQPASMATQQPQQQAYPPTQSAYAPVQPMVPAPPAPIMSQDDFGNNNAAPSQASIPPPPPKKPDGGWNDIPVLAPKRSTSAMSARSNLVAQPITSPFPNASPAPAAGAVQPPPPSYGPAAGAASAQVAPPPRGMQPPPPRGLMSPPPPPAGGQYNRPMMSGQPMSGMHSPTTQMRPPPPMGPPRGGTPASGHRMPSGMSQQPPMPQSSGPYSPAPGQVSVPPPPGSATSRSSGPLGAFSPPPQFRQPGMQGPAGSQPLGFNRPPMPAIPGAGHGPPQNVPMRSVTPGAGAGPPPRSATPAKPALKYPPGDRSHIPESAKPIAATLTKELVRFKSITPPTQKRTADEVEKRVNSLLDLLNCSILEPRIVQGLHGICQAIEARNQQAALSQHVQLASTASGDVFAGLVGIKQLISKLNQ
jgi:protein transport protein SEC31